MSWQLGPWCVYPSLNRLQGAGADRSLEPRVMVALMTLIDGQGTVISDEQMLSAVWGDQVVSDASLYKVIAELRKALGDSDKPYQFIERVSSKGYRLLQTATRSPVPANLPETAAEIGSESIPEHTGESPFEPGDDGRPRTRKLTMFFLCSAVLLAVAVITVLIRYDTSPKPPSGTVAQIVPNSPVPTVQKPPGMGQELWDEYLQARWFSAQRRPQELKQAISLFQRVLADAPTFAAAEVELCNSYHYQYIYSDWPLSKVLALCEPLLRHALQTDAASAAALATFGSLKLSQGDENAAAIYLDKSLVLEPNDAMALMWRANLYRHQGMLEQSVALMARATQRDPLSGMIKRNYAFALISSGKLGPARRMFQDALLLEPNYSDRAIDELDMLPLTVSRARSFLQWAHRFPDRIGEAGNPLPAVNLALINLSIGQLKEADQALKMAEAKLPQHQFVLLARAMWYDANNEQALALQKLQQRAALQAANSMYALFALMYSAQANPITARPPFENLFPEFRRDPQTTVKNYLDNGQGVVVMFWLTTLADAERDRYRDTINHWLVAQTEHDSLSLNLHLLLRQYDQADTLAVAMLRDGWLPSPNDDFYVPLRHPLWRKLDRAVFAAIAHNQAQVTQGI